RAFHSLRKPPTRTRLRAAKPASEKRTARPGPQGNTRPAANVSIRKWKCWAGSWWWAPSCWGGWRCGGGRRRAGRRWSAAGWSPANVDEPDHVGGTAIEDCFSDDVELRASDADRLPKTHSSTELSQSAASPRPFQPSEPVQLQLDTPYHCVLSYNAASDTAQL